ncbi:MAG TPA: MobF family relaxase [Acidimicrobiia bacterium]|nr:MobF family relaxase [Acidimicrobiia bacterium]
MLTVTGIGSAEYLLDSVAVGIEDYYVGSGEAPGVWHGQLAADLGLVGVVDPDDLRALLIGDEPGTGVGLLDGHRSRKIAAFDLTFSAPKSVSLLWAFAGPEVSAVASIAHVEAVAVALDFMERRAGATRQMVDGERRRLPTGIAAATFVHRTSREGDPQLHTHAVVANLGRRPDGSFAALDATPIYEWAKAAGSVYQEELRSRLTARLGLEWGPDRNGCREIMGLDPGWLRTFSKRTQAIEEHLAAAGPEHPTPKQRMRADNDASLATRPAKDRSFTPEMLRDRWQSEADQIGMPTGHALEAEACGRTAPELQPALEWDDVVEALIDPESGLCAHRARFREAHVVEQVAALGGGRLDVAAVEQLATAFLGSEEAVLLVDRTGRRSPEYSTVDHLLTEDAVLYHLDRLISRRVDGIDETVVERAIAAEAPGLGADQAAAVRALCSGGEALCSLISPAGFGKTTTVHAAVVAAGHAGLPVVGLAATNQAVDELRHAGIPAMTIARFTLDGAHLAPNTVVVLDEVSQVATADAEIVLAAVAGTAGVRLWCLGDPHQAQPVRAGGLGAEIARLGTTGRIPAPALTVNRRQEDPAEQRALARYRSGLVATSQAIRRDHGWEHDLGSPHATRESLADSVVADIDKHGPAEVVALAVSHVDCEDLADRIRSRLQAQGLIQGPDLIGPAWRAGERHYAAGDRILVHGTLRLEGQRLHNGTVLTVTAVDDAGLFGIDQQGRVTKLPRAFVEGRRRDGSPNCSHAWARTVDGIQGGTWTQAHLLGTVALERFTGYVGQSRSRQPTHTWNVTRTPEVDFGGVPADQRSAEKVVLDALRRQPDTGFAIHDAPSRVEQLLDKQSELRHLLRQRPPDVGPGLRQAERALASAENELHNAHLRLQRAEERLAGFGKLSQLRRHGREEKLSTLDRIERCNGHVRTAGTKAAQCRDELGDLRSQRDRRAAWDAEHDWPAERLRGVESELASLAGRAHSPERAGRTHLLDRSTGPDHGGRYEIAGVEIRPPARGPDLGIDLGL